MKKMFFAIIIIICIIAGFVHGVKSWCSVLDGIAEALIGLLIGVLISAAIAGLSLCFTPSQTETQTQEITALADNPRYNHYKSGYLICNGSEQLKYTYMYETDKGLTVKEVRANKSYIQTLPEGEQPYVIITATYRKNIIIGKIIIGYEYTFYLPPNSVVDGYQIDLQ